MITRVIHFLQVFFYKSLLWTVSTHIYTHTHPHVSVYICIYYIFIYIHINVSIYYIVIYILLLMILNHSIYALWVLPLCFFLIMAIIKIKIIFVVFLPFVNYLTSAFIFLLPTAALWFRYHWHPHFMGEKTEAQ